MSLSCDTNRGACLYPGGKNRVKGRNDTQVKQLIAEHWPENAYTSTTLCRGGILGAEVGDTRVVLVSKDKYSGSQLERNLCIQVSGIKGKKIPTGDVLVAESTDSVLFEGEERGEVERSRLLMVVGLTLDQEANIYDESEIIGKQEEFVWWRKKNPD